MKFAAKPIQHYPPQLSNVATLPWKIKIFCRYERKCKQIIINNNNNNSWNGLAWSGCCGFVPGVFIAFSRGFIKLTLWFLIPLSWKEFFVYFVTLRSHV